MKNYSTIKAGLLNGTIILLILLMVASMAIGYNVRSSDSKMLPETYKFNRYLYPENYDCYDLDEIPDSEKYINREHSDNDNIYPDIVINPDKKPQPAVSPPMESPWPMYCHDIRHTGRSPYSTADNPGNEKWWFKCDNGFVEGSGVIDNDGAIYFGSWNGYFYSLNPDGSLKWKFKIGGNVQSSGPAIDENGIIYVGTAHNTVSGNRLYAFYPNGTVKWTFFIGDNMFSSPVISDDGTIYLAKDNTYPHAGFIMALYPNGTLRWLYQTGHYVHSDPAIGLDGTIYCGSHDGYLYALYPNNGTLKWKFGTEDWVARGPCIGDDGTIYFGSWDGNLYALYPNGTLKWKAGVVTCTNPVLGEDGTIYVGYRELAAVYPNNGSVKWIFDVPGRVLASNLCVSADGIIYFGTQDGGHLVAVNPDGSERWRRFIGECYFAPVIGEDGTVYIGSSNDEWVGGGYVATGYLHAFNELDPDAPSAPEVDGRQDGKVGKEYEYTFKATSPLGRDIYYYVDWGDKSNTGWMGPYKSGEKIELKHSWREKDVFTISSKVKDANELWGPWSYFEVEIPRNKVSYNSFFLPFLERFPMLERLLNLLIK